MRQRLGTKPAESTDLGRGAAPLTGIARQGADLTTGNQGVVTGAGSDGWALRRINLASPAMACGE